MQLELLGGGGGSDLEGGAQEDGEEEEVKVEDGESAMMQQGMVSAGRARELLYQQFHEVIDLDRRDCVSQQHPTVAVTTLATWMLDIVRVRWWAGSKA